VMGIAPDGIGCHLLEIMHGPERLAPALEVDGELGREFPRPGATARLRADSTIPMALPAPRGAYLLVQGLLVQRMLKAVAAPTGAIRPDHDAGVLDQLVLRRQRVTPRLHVF